METIPFIQDIIPCGFPSPAADQSEESINLQEYLVRHKTSTLCVRCSGDSMNGAHIIDGDILVVDRQIRAKDGDIVLAVYDGAFVIKRLRLRGGMAVLHAENPAYRDIPILREEELSISGVVVGVVRKYEK
ncbi:MAG: translesion error-prone DNA polymerase V autoproteolytic subunit [Sphaerochaeta sp.]|jgi:DNA polymerase V|nr:translesion error-prone DNA polymerase V autoproteolytic subunit [Sphaerochaeta sp.]MCH3920952.1 translesion error-prone DNA polymerase V autoproteolytic subunit [Sphaerochaeta sp.]MCI2045149.1 translesion error-prone DNA polymerase V autoproteolytic subunit [Sphaerochaeta sp.]MCI2075837.1 translesion error-prone DNA polymerase V autoproteolytic subunit [Sphaerochaeta sp.]MCI2096988.1 translesion error-prone DNA polymerase V autoproteolytic subunit [Sphaerochaeta sp.]